MRPEPSEPGERGRRRGREGLRQMLQGLVGRREDLDSSSEGGGSLGGCEQRRDKTHLTCEFGKYSPPNSFYPLACDWPLSSSSSTTLKPRKSGDG